MLEVSATCDLSPSGVTGFAWHPTDPSAIAWVEESEDGFALTEGRRLRRRDHDDANHRPTRHGPTRGVGLVGVRPPG